MTTIHYAQDPRNPNQNKPIREPDSKPQPKEPGRNPGYNDDDDSGEGRPPHQPDKM